MIQPGLRYANAADLDGKRVFVGWSVMKCRDGQVYTASVGSYRDNDFGLYDVLATCWSGPVRCTTR